MTRILSSVNNTNNTQVENLCVSRGVPNSHQEGNYCICDSGYFTGPNKTCVLLSTENCVNLYGQGVTANTETNTCACNTGYTANSSRGACVPNSTTANSNVVSPPSVPQIKTEVKNVPIIKKKPAPVRIKVETIATSTATTTNESNFRPLSPTPTPPSNPAPKNKPLWQKFLSWFGW